MKLDLKRMAGAIAANAENGPGDPIDELNKKLADQGLYFDKSSKTVKSIPGWSKQKQIQGKANDAMYSSLMDGSVGNKLEQFADVPGFKATYDRFLRQTPETGDALKSLLIKEGIMALNPKSGDLYMTEKGADMNKKGLLTKYKLQF